MKVTFFRDDAYSIQAVGILPSINDELHNFVKISGKANIESITHVELKSIIPEGLLDLNSVMIFIKSDMLIRGKLVTSQSGLSSS